jgi:hypothetical protein
MCQINSLHLNQHLIFLPHILHYILQLVSAHIRVIFRGCHLMFKCSIFSPSIGCKHWYKCAGQMVLCGMLLCSIPHSTICTRLFRGKIHSDWFNGIEILQGRWQHGENVGYCYPSGLEKTLCKWDIHVPLVTKGLSCAETVII